MTFFGVVMVGVPFVMVLMDVASHWLNLPAAGRQEQMDRQFR
jgi:hypothetical protein